MVARAKGIVVEKGPDTKSSLRSESYHEPDGQVVRGCNVTWMNCLEVVHVLGSGTEMDHKRR